MENIPFISSKYEIGKFNRVCNEKDCHKFPAKEILITETDKKIEKTRDIASLFFCNGHFKEAHKELSKDLKQFETPLKKLDMKIFEIGYITY